MSEQVEVRGDTPQIAEQASEKPERRGLGGVARRPYSWIRGRKAGGSRIPSGSPLYTRVMPILIVGMGLLTAALILFAAGVILGVVPFR